MKTETFDESKQAPKILHPESYPFKWEKAQKLARLKYPMLDENDRIFIDAYTKLYVELGGR